VFNTMAAIEQTRDEDHAHQISPDIGYRPREEEAKELTKRNLINSIVEGESASVENNVGRLQESRLVLEESMMTIQQ